MRDASRTKAAVRLGLVIVVLAALAGAGWWWFVDRTVTTGHPTADPPPTLGERLDDALGTENSATTEADPPPAREGESWARAAGLHKVPDELRLNASAAVVVEQDSGKVLLRKNEDAVLPIASLTKLMTALVVTEAALPLDEVISITEDDVDRERHSRSRLRVGTTLTRGEALRLALMSSENRAAHALGRHYPGGLDAFVRAMNRKARALGLRHTSYADPTGLSNRNRSTARELAVLAAAAAKVPLIREYSATPQHEALLGQRKVRYNNSNRLVKSERWDIALQKTGYIVEAGQCLVIDARLGERNLILVLLDSADKRSRLDDAERIRHWATGEPYRPVRQVSLRDEARKAQARVKKTKDRVKARVKARIGATKDQRR